MIFVQTKLPTHHPTPVMIRNIKSEISKNQNIIEYSPSTFKYLKIICDIIQKNILPIVAKKNRFNIGFSQEGKDELTIFHSKVCTQIFLLKEVLIEFDPIKAKKALPFLSCLAHGTKKSKKSIRNLVL